MDYIVVTDCNFRKLKMSNNNILFTFGFNKGADKAKGKRIEAGMLLTCLHLNKITKREN